MVRAQHGDCHIVLVEKFIIYASGIENVIVIVEDRNCGDIHVTFSDEIQWYWRFPICPVVKFIVEAKTLA